MYTNRRTQTNMSISLNTLFTLLSVTCWRLLLPAVALAGNSPGHGDAPCGFTAGSRSLQPGLRQCLRPQALAMPMGDRGCWRLPLMG
ncbi:hypothetical protein GW17_00058686 [Ensete ventricosum]|nr:hypothetical protein GW17_00058686 [Ensete ventricosum]